MSGYNIACSDYHNTLALENDQPQHHDPSDYRYIIWQRGSQWLYGLSSADGQILAHSSGEDHLYALGDATGLYNSDYEGSTDIMHASRSIVWLKPDHIIVYDRATSQTAGCFKRFWLQLPAQAVVSGNRTTMTTASGQQLFITTLLPAGAVITSEPAEPLDSEPANEEPMQYRLRVEPAETSPDVRFLHVLEGADSGTPADTVTIVKHDDGTPFTGASVNDSIVLFPVDPNTTFTSLTYTAPLNITKHLITGLPPDGGYDVVTETSGVDLQVTIIPGTAYHADSGGVLAWGQESKGDLNCDGRITVADAIIALKMAVRGEHNENADMNGDGQVTALDAIMILQAAAGRIEL